MSSGAGVKAMLSELCACDWAGWSSSLSLAGKFTRACRSSSRQQRREMFAFVMQQMWYQ
jgi:hypothetical protein